MKGYKSILVHVTTEESAKTRVRIASSLAERLDAHLIGLGAGFINLPVDFTGDAGATAMIADIEMKELQLELEAAGNAFFQAAGSASGRPEWRSCPEPAAEAIPWAARAADLIVLGRSWTPHTSNYNCAASPGDVLLQAGRPILLVPPHITSLDGSRVVVAWKDTREARRAVMDALPLLQGAERVSVVEICEDDHGAAAAAARATDVARYLLRHGIGAEGSAAPREQGSAADQIMRFASAQGADLIVAGGYGHARMREWVFGGVTRDLLQRSEYCCLLSH